MYIYIYHDVLYVLWFIEARLHQARWFIKALSQMTDRSQANRTSISSKRRETKFWKEPCSTVKMTIFLLLFISC